MSRAFHLISSTYGWTDEMILDKTLRRIRQIVAAISEERLAEQKEHRLIASWQTRSLAMIVAASSMGENKELMEFASRLTIDREEYQEFGHKESEVAAPIKSNLKVHATTQQQAVEENLNAAADRNNSDMLALFGNSLERGKPGH